MRLSVRSCSGCRVEGRVRRRGGGGGGRIDRENKGGMRGEEGRAHRTGGEEKRESKDIINFIKQKNINELQGGVNVDLNSRAGDGS